MLINIWFLHMGNQDEYCVAKEAFKRKISLLTSKLKIELTKRLVTFYAWRAAFYGPETWAITKVEGNYLGIFEMCCWRRI